MTFSKGLRYGECKVSPRLILQGVTAHQFGLLPPTVAMQNGGHDKTFWKLTLFKIVSGMENLIVILRIYFNGSVGLMVSLRSLGIYDVVGGGVYADLEDFRQVGGDLMLS